MWRTGSPAPIIERVMRSIVIDEYGCWVWQLSCNGMGYGRITVQPSVPGPRHPYVHRLTYEHFVGPIPDGLVLDHLCRNPPCCNPAHLEPVTQSENALRGVAARSTV